MRCRRGTWMKPLECWACFERQDMLASSNMRSSREKKSYLPCLVPICIVWAQKEESAQDVLELKTPGRKYILLRLFICLLVLSALPRCCCLV